MDTLEHLLMIVLLRSLEQIGDEEITSLVFDLTTIYAIEIDEAIQ